MELRDGNIKRQLAVLALPMIAGNILQQLYNTADAWVVGRYAGMEAFAAIGAAGCVMNLFLFTLIGCCGGASILFAQFYGAGDEARFRQEHALSLALGLALTAALSALGLCCTRGILALARTPEDLIGYAESYLRVIFLGLPAAFLYNLYSALLRAIGSTLRALVILAVSAACNIALDFLLVGALGMGIAGAALATVLSQLLSALVAIAHFLRAYPRFRVHAGDLRAARPLVKKTLSFAAASSFHQAGLYLGKFAVQGAVNTCGTQAVAAFTAAGRIEGFANSFGDSGSAATPIHVAQNYGADRPDRVRRAFRDSMILLAGAGLVSALLMCLGARPLSSLMLGRAAGEAFEQAAAYLQTISLFYLFCFTGNTYAGYYDGIGRPALSFLGALSHITLRAILCWCFVGRGGLRMVALATGIGWIWVNLLWTLLKRKIAGRSA